MKRLPDAMLVKAALNVYAKHLRGFEHDDYKADLDRVMELRTKKIVANSLVITIKLEL